MLSLSTVTFVMSCAH